jgi:hypothetical protein
VSDPRTGLAIRFIRQFQADMLPRFFNAPAIDARLIQHYAGLPLRCLDDVLAAARQFRHAAAQAKQC